MKMMLSFLLVISVTVGSAYAFTHGVAATPCPSTGVFDLTNTCNDVYFIGALK